MLQSSHELNILSYTNVFMLKPFNLVNICAGFSMRCHFYQGIYIPKEISSLEHLLGNRIAFI